MARSGTWTHPETLDTPPTIQIGVCKITDTAVRFGIGTSSAAWSRLSNQRNWFEVTVEPVGGGTFGAPRRTLRVSKDDSFATSWYVRFTKLSNGALRISAFTPSDAEGPTEDQFNHQAEQSAWQPSSAGHSGYVESILDLSGVSTTLLDSICVSSAAPNYVAGQLRAIEWMAVRPVRID